MTTYATKAENAGFELQVCKIGSYSYARIMKGDLIAARFTSAPIACGIRQAVSAFKAFDFNDIMTDTAKQAVLLSLIPMQRPSYCA